MSSDIYQTLDTFCDEVLLHNNDIRGTRVWIRDSSPEVFGGAFRDAFRQEYGFCISQKELRRVELMGYQTAYAVQTYIEQLSDATNEQITVFAKAMIWRQISAYEEDDEDDDD